MLVKFVSSQISPNILHGSPAKPGEYPGIVLLLIHRDDGCAGTLIDDINILTAGHCVLNAKKDEVCYK